jgi:3'-5' exonuclease
MTTVVFDIETVSFPWLELDALQREKLTRWAEDHEDFLRRKKNGSLSPYTGKVIVIGMQNPDTNRGIVWFEEPGGRTARQSADGLFEYIGCDEPAMLAEFWKTVEKFDRFVTFNGRTFDGPFLSIRSAVHGISPSKNLIGKRFEFAAAVDLMEVLTFQGAVARDQQPNLHAACVAFGIPSPKSEEMHGYAVGDAYREGRLEEILEYCRRDVEATAALYRRLESTLLPLFRK